MPQLVTEQATRPVMVPRVLILDDEGAAGWAPIVGAIRQRGVGVLVTSANDSAVDLVTACEAEVVVLELRAPTQTGLDLMAKIKAASPDTEVILTTHDVSLEEAIAAHRGGAFDVIRRPLQPCELGSAIFRAKEKRRSARDTAAVLREGQRLLSVRERERLPALAVDFAHRAMRADVVSLMLRDTAGRLYIAHANGLPTELVSGTRLQIGQRIAGRVAELRAPVLIDDALFRDDRFDDLVPFGRVQSSIVYPLLVEERLIGILNIGRSTAEQPYVPADLARAGIVASQITLAFETLKQWQRTGMADRLAITGQIAGSVAHELNNPLAAVVGQCDLALDSLAGAAALAASATAGDDLRRALEDVRTCVEDARLAAAAVQAVASDLRASVPGDVAREAIAELDETVRAALRLAKVDVRRQATIVKNLEPGLFVAADSGLICQVFLNLILNANQVLRASATAAPQITITAVRAEGGIRVDVSDNGPGLTSDEAARILEPFLMARGASSRFGLGISIANDIVQSLGGRLEVTSAPGHGTSFSVTLPERPCVDYGASSPVDWSLAAGPTM